MRRISFIFIVAFSLVTLVTGCGRTSDTDPDAWKYDLDLPVPISFGEPLAVTRGGELETLDGLELGIFALEHGDALQINWNSGPNILLNNIIGEIDRSQGYVELKDGPYYYPLDNHRNYSFYGYYPTKYVTGEKVSIIREDDALIAFMKIKDHHDILWAGTMASTEVSTIDGKSYSGFNGRYIRKVVLNDESKMPSLAFEHKTTNIVFNARPKNASDVPEFVNLDFKITGITINSITNETRGEETKIPRRAKLYIAVENSSRQNDGSIAGTTPKGHKPGDLVPDENPAYLGNVPYTLDVPISFTDGNKDQNQKIGQFFLVPFDGVQGDKLNLTIDYSVTINEKTKDKTFDAQIDIGNKSFEAGKKYVYNILFYPPTEIQIGFDETKLNWELQTGGDGEDVDMDQIS